jgi:hypothetical protein
MLSVSELRDALVLLKGKECWSIVAGAGTGSAIHLEFGAKVPRRVPLRERPRLSAEQVCYEGEIDLFVQCAWRLERSQSVICGSTDDDRNDGPMVEGLSELRGMTVQDVDVSDPIPDFELRLTGDMRLKVFCDQTNIETNIDNYSVRVGETIYVVASKGQLATEKRNSE